MAFFLLPLLGWSWWDSIPSLVRLVSWFLGVVFVAWLVDLVLEHSKGTKSSDKKQQPVH